MRVLVTRPDDDAAETVRRLSQAGHQAILSPMLKIHFLESGPLDSAGVQAWLATSRNGVRALVRNGADAALPLLAVGRSTADLARASGFGLVHDADGDVEDLVALTARLLLPGAGRVFHAAGKEVAGDLVAGLSKLGFEVERKVLYQAEPMEELRSDTRLALIDRQIDAALFFSARSAAAFARVLLNDDRAALALAQTTAICISERAAIELSGLKFASVIVAARPNQDALLYEMDKLSQANW